MKPPTIVRDVTEEHRAKCEEAVIAAGHCSPRSSVHECKLCGIHIPWNQLRWVEIEGIKGIVSGHHDCKRYTK